MVASPVGALLASVADHATTEAVMSAIRILLLAVVLSGCAVDEHGRTWADKYYGLKDDGPGGIPPQDNPPTQSLEKWGQQQPRPFTTCTIATVGGVYDNLICY